MSVPSHAPADYVCPFCLLAAARYDHPVLYSGPEDEVYRDDRVLAVIASHQWPGVPGNTLIIPLAHHENIYTLPVVLAAPIHAAAQAVALALKAAYGCDGVSTRQHNEPAGNQDVWHYHLHVTPRYAGDALYARLATEKALMPAPERAQHAARIRAHLPPVVY